MSYSYPFATGEHLVLSVPDSTSAEANMTLNWGLTNQGAAFIKQFPVDTHFSVFLVVTSFDERGDEDEDERCIEDLSSLRTVISFGGPGRHVVRAALVPWGTSCVYENYDKKAGKKHMLGVDKKEGGYAVDLPDLLFANSLEFAAIEVDVSPGFFASPPPALLRWMADFENPWTVVNQCDYRRQLLMFTPRFVLFLLKTALFLVIALAITALRLPYLFILVVRGSRGIQWKHMLVPPPFDGDDDKRVSDAIWGKLLHDPKDRGSFFWKDASGKDRPWYIVMLDPAVLFGLFMLYLIGRWFVLDVVGVRLSMFAGGSILVLILLVSLWNWFLSTEPGKQYQHTQALRRREEGERQQEAYGHMVAQIGPDGQLQLPKPRITIRLMVQDLKAQICRPFAVK